MFNVGAWEIPLSKIEGLSVYNVLVYYKYRYWAYICESMLWFAVKVLKSQFEIYVSALMMAHRILAMLLGLLVALRQWCCNYCAYALFGYNAGFGSCHFDVVHF